MGIDVAQSMVALDSPESLARLDFLSEKFFYGRLPWESGRVAGGRIGRVVHVV